jgi:hypothetical protein
METDLNHYVLAKSPEHAIEQTEECDAKNFYTDTCTWSATSAELMTDREIMEDKRHAIVLKPTQEQMYYRAARLTAECDEVFQEMITGDNAITKKELRQMIAKRPEVWGRYSAYLNSHRLKEGNS